MKPTVRCPRRNLPTISLCLGLFVVVALSTSGPSSAQRESNKDAAPDTHGRGEAPGIPGPGALAGGQLIKPGPSMVLDSNPMRHDPPTHFGADPSQLSAAACGPQPDSFYLSFPLPNRTAYTAVINSVFDHVSPAYNNDGRITTFTGEEGKSEYQPVSADCYGVKNNLCGMRNLGRVSFLVNGNYGGSLLYYDGHDGYDFKTTDQGNGGNIDVLAAADGDLRCFSDGVNTLDIDHRNGYRTRYLHMSARLCPPPNQASIPVTRGQRVGTADGVGAAGRVHLHFSVFFNGSLVDPYGWQGQYPDPRLPVRSTNVWKPKAYAACSVRWHPDGTLISDGRTVWLVQGGKKRGITGTDVFYAYGFDFANVINVSQEELNALSDGPNLGMPPANRLRNDNGTFYEIVDLGNNNLVRRGVTSAEVFQGQGFQWCECRLSAAGIPNDQLVGNYGSIFRDGTLLREPNGTISIISNGKRMSFATAGAFTSLGYRFADTVPVSSGDPNAAACKNNLVCRNFYSLPSGPTITEQSITQSSGRIQSGGNDIWRPTLRALIDNYLFGSSVSGASASAKGAGMVSSADTLTLSGAATDDGTGDNGISSVTINGVRATADTANGTGTANWSQTFSLAPGDNTFTVVATDNSPNRNVSMQVVTINYQPPASDTTGPSVSVSSHREGQRVSSNVVRIFGTATDAGNGDDGVSSVTVNGVRASQDATNSWGVAHWSQLLTLQPGPNVINIRARDASPNQNPTFQSFTLTVATGLGAAVRAARPPRNDFDGDGRADIAVWRPLVGVWYITNSSGVTARTTKWGGTGEVPTPADYDGDGKADTATWTPATGVWLISSSLDGTFRTPGWGTTGDIPVPADYDGDGRADIAVWRPDSGAWFIINSRDGSVTAKGWGSGELGDIPVPADYDGDRRTDLAVWRPSAGAWFIISSRDGSVTARGWGSGDLGDIPVPADYDGDGRADLAVWRPDSGAWFVINSAGGAVTARGWGTQDDVPVPADYDGDGRTDLAVWRPSAGAWFVINSLNNSVTAKGWGSGDLGDVPVSVSLNIADSWPAAALSFVESDPGIPGDAITINAGAGEVDSALELSSLIPFSNFTDGFTLSVYTSPDDLPFNSLSFNIITLRPDGPCQESFGTGGGISSGPLRFNEVVGYSVNIPQSQLDSIVQSQARSKPECGFTARDFYIARIFLNSNQANNFGIIKMLDAAAIGRGQNNVWGVRVPTRGGL